MAGSLRLIARLDIKGENLIKGVHFEGLRVIGDPGEYARKYYMQGADELIYIDSVASLYGRNNLVHIVERTVKDIFIPLTVGGGVRTVDDARHLLRSGADKIAINTAAVRDPNLISALAEEFGSQCIVLSIQAKQIAREGWEAYTDNGRERTGKDVLEWVSHAVALGAGEVLLTSVDHDGTRRGFDTDLVRMVTAAVAVPIIVSGGMGRVDDMDSIMCVSEVSAIAMGAGLHHDVFTIADVREHAIRKGWEVRSYA